MYNAYDIMTIYIPLICFTRKIETIGDPSHSDNLKASIWIYFNNYIL